MKLCEIEDQEKLKLRIKGGILNNIDIFNEIKANLRNRSFDELVNKKSTILSLLDNFNNKIYDAIVVLSEYDNDREAENMIEIYEKLLGAITVAKQMTNKNTFNWIKN